MAYDTLDREYCLEILATFGMGPQDIRLFSDGTGTD